MATPIPENRATFSAESVATATGGTLFDRGAPGRSTTTPSSGVTSDSRIVGKVPGGVFVALVGERIDGHTFLSAIDGIAGVVVCAGGRGNDVTKSHVVEVADTLVAWGDLAGAHLERWRKGSHERRVVAITGSAGKTTTKELVAALLAVDGIAPGAPGARVQKTRGNLNNRIGMPATAFTVEDAHAYAVLELGMNVPGEIAAMASLARPDVAIVTNIGVAHSEGVGGRDGVAKEKGDLFAHLAADGVAIVNADCTYSLREVKRSSGARIVTFGLAEGADYRLVSREVDDVKGAVVVLRRPTGEITVRFPLLGEHAAIDLLAALAGTEAALGRALDVSEIEAAFARTELAGRGSLIRLGNGAFVIDDSYNANPASMTAALRTLSELGRGRRTIAVLGEMKELGALAEPEHDALGDAVVSANVGVFVSCGGLVARACAKTKAAGLPTFEYMNAQDAATFVTSHLDSSDIVLVKGSRSIATEKVVDALVAAFARPVVGERAT